MGINPKKGNTCDIAILDAPSRGTLQASQMYRQGLLPYGPERRVTMKHPRMNDLKATGERIRLTLARFFVNLTHVLNATADEAQVLKTNLATPFE